MNDFQKYLETSKGKVRIADLKEVDNVDQLPFSIRILLENVMRNIDGLTVT